MSLGLKYIGLAFAIAALAAFVHLYIRNQKKRRLCYIETAGLISYVSERLKTKRASLFALALDFDCRELKENGFISSLEFGGRADEAAERLTMDKSDKEKLREFLRDFGKAYLDTELERIAEALIYFKKRAEAEDTECNDRIRLALVLFSSFAVGLSLLCI